MFQIKQTKIVAINNHPTNNMLLTPTENNRILILCFFFFLKVGPLFFPSPWFCRNGIVKYGVLYFFWCRNIYLVNQLLNKPGRRRGGGTLVQDWWISYLLTWIIDVCALNKKVHLFSNLPRMKKSSIEYNLLR